MSKEDYEGFSLGDRARIRFWASQKESSKLFPGQGQGADALRVPCGAPPPTESEDHE